MVVYTTEDGRSRVLVRVEGGTVWLTQAQLAELFQTTVPNINIHLKNLVEEGEINPEATIKEYLIVRSEGSREVKRSVTHYNLDVILAVGYRVRSLRGTQFRQWATERLREYLVKGFVMDDERLANGTMPDDYFEELLERIRAIRASERRFYQKITDIYATAVDYRGDAEQAQLFFKTVQNKLHWAITGHTAAELVAGRADAAKPNMGLTTWKGQRPHKSDVTVAKNYLTAEELSELNRIVTMYLDHAEDQARRRRTLTMTEWAAKLDAFLQFNDRQVLGHAGKVSQQVAERLAHEQYDAWTREQRRIEAETDSSDFDRAVTQLGKKGRKPPKSE
ncbi:hydroxyacid dehydrogenase [bacterium]|nr:hydroxyacid dehydrogenase [bacterium]